MTFATMVLTCTLGGLYFERDIITEDYDQRLRGKRCQCEAQYPDMFDCGICDNRSHSENVFKKCDEHTENRLFSHNIDPATMDRTHKIKVLCCENKIGPWRNTLEAALEVVSSTK